MTTRDRTFQSLVYGTMTLITAVTISLMSQVVAAQDKPNRGLQKEKVVWKVSVISAELPERVRLKLQAEVEEDRLVCRSADSAVLEIPLTAITRITRDSTKEYPMAEFFAGLATHPSIEHHLVGTKEYRDEMKARATLAAIAFVGLLFPKHKEAVLVAWTDELGEHYAEFHIGRKQGRTMLKELQKQTGLEPQDLEMERKRFEKELRRWNQKKSHESQGNP
jgi:hypothetical protein